MMNINKKVIATEKPGPIQSSELNSSFNINNALEKTRKRMGKFSKKIRFWAEREQLVILL
jgi:hypothetical protein